MSECPIYLDYNASAPLRNVAKEAVVDGLDYTGNTSSVHRFGREARKKLEEARSRIKTTLGCVSDTLIFTSGGTESNNLALQAFPHHLVLMSATSHASALQARDDVSLINVHSSGLMDLKNLVDCLSKAKDHTSDLIVSFEVANNETGVLQPVNDIVKIAKSYGALVHGDGAQALGRIPFNFEQSGLDLFSFSSHKVGGPSGIGGLLVRHGLDPQPVLRGGGQEYGKRAGSASISTALGFAAAIDEALCEGPSSWKPITEHLSKIENFVESVGGKIIARQGGRLPNTCSVRMPGVLAETQIMALDLDGFAVSAGSACSSGKVEASHVLRAMGLTDREARETIRISLCPGISDLTIERFLKAWERLFLKASDMTDGGEKG